MPGRLDPPDAVPDNVDPRLALFTFAALVGSCAILAAFARHFWRLFRADIAEAKQIGDTLWPLSDQRLGILVQCVIAGLVLTPAMTLGGLLGRSTMTYHLEAVRTQVAISGSDPTVTFTTVITMQLFASVVLFFVSSFVIQAIGTSATTAAIDLRRRLSAFREARASR